MLRLILIVAGTLAVLSCLDKSDLQILAEVKDGTRTLSCWIGDGIKDIDPAKVTGYFEGTWTFTNGQARACRTKEVNK